MILNRNELIEKISDFKDKKNAVILAHNYQNDEVQDVADFTGDSLELSQKSASLDAEIILFCGVKFMAETAKILAPEKVVLLPVSSAGCPMADMAQTQDIGHWQKQFRNPYTVTYVNSSAAVKALSDICVTSSNAVKIISDIPEDKEILFIPDSNLGAYAAEQANRKIHLWKGFCPTHIKVNPSLITEKKKLYPDAEVLLHPEIPADALKLADKVLSTGGMVKYCRQSKTERFLIGTEKGLLYRLRKENPGKEFIPLSEKLICPMMKKTNLQDVYRSLVKMEYKINIEDDIIEDSLKPIKRMLEYV